MKGDIGFGVQKRHKISVKKSCQIVAKAAKGWQKRDKTWQKIVILVGGFYFLCRILGVSCQGLTASQAAEGKTLEDGLLQLRSHYLQTVSRVQAKKWLTWTQAILGHGKQQAHRRIGQLRASSSMPHTACPHPRSELTLVA